METLAPWLTPALVLALFAWLKRDMRDLHKEIRTEISDFRKEMNARFDVDAVSVACRLTAATRAWSRASLATAFRRFADPRHFLLTARPARRTRLASAAAPLGFAKRSTIPPSTDARTASVFTPTSSPALHAGAGRRRRSQSRLIDRYHASASRVTRAVLTRPRQRTRSAIRIQPSFGTRTPRPSNSTS